MTKRLSILLVVLLCGFSSIWLLPKSFALQVSALPGGLRTPGQSYDLPNLVGFWSGGKPRNASDKEIKVLAKDTIFLKKNYLRQNTSIIPPRLPEDASEQQRMLANARHEEVEVSIVTSGSDMGNSIHRPERCLDAQGFSISGDKKLILQVNGRPLPVKRLIASQQVKDEKTGQIFVYHNVTYYWFVGHYTLTNDHYSRTFLDIKDRLIEGYDQEWAYATVGMMVDPHFTEFPDETQPGKRVLARPVNAVAEDANGLTEADKIIQEFIVDLAKEIIDRKMIKAWNQAPTAP
jgi:hypothetical protein